VLSVGPHETGGAGETHPLLGYHMCSGKQLKGTAAMKFFVKVDRDEDGVWIAECPTIPGCVSQGDTRQEAIANVREAIARCLEVRAERGLPLTIETTQVEVALWRPPMPSFKGRELVRLF
jgi:predicted RNase H-like HicB family nuclease